MDQRRYWYFGWWATRTKGSDTSGNYFHKGRPKIRGGSLPGGGHKMLGISSLNTEEEKRTMIGLHRQMMAKRRAAKKKPPDKKPTPKPKPKPEPKPPAPAKDTPEAIMAAMLEGTKDLQAQKEAAEARQKSLRAEITELQHERYRYGRWSPEASKRTAQEELEAERKYGEINKQIDRLYSDETEAYREISSAEKALREEGMKYLEVPKEQQANVQLDFGRLRVGREEAQAGVDLFNRLCGTGTVNGKVAAVARTSSSRAHYIPTLWGGKEAGKVGLSTKSGKTTMLHELGHWFEDNDSEVSRKALDFLNRRTQGEGARRLSSIYPGYGYGRREIAKPDKFMDAYMGKIYTPLGGQGATEIISMGLQKMFQDPVGLAKQDPDYMAFMLNLLRGK